MKFYKWIERKCKEHNDRLTYVNYEESWTPQDFIFSVVGMGIILPTVLTVLGICSNVPLWIIIPAGVIMSASIIGFHFFHLLT